MNDMIKFGEAVIKQDGEMVNLTDLWRASGKDEVYKPIQWQRKEGRTFVSALTLKLKVPVEHLLKTTKGRTGSTWAHWQIGLAYAKYLSPELHMAINQVFRERVEEERDPDLAYDRGKDRAVKGWQKQGRDNAWISERITGQGQRKSFTDTLQAHGVTGSGYGQCTNGIYEPILGDKAAVVKQQRGLSKRESIRDHASKSELIGIRLAESLAEEKIEANGIRGNRPCVATCHDAGTIVGKAIRDFRIS